MPAERGRSAAEGPQCAAVLLAGGTGSRLGGAEKALLRRGSTTLLRAWLAALAGRSIDVAVVGPSHLRPQLDAPELSPRTAAAPGPKVLLTREDPPLSGPAAGVASGVRTLAAAELLPREGHVLLLAVDTVDPALLLDWLQGFAPEPGRGVLPADAAGREQRLASMVDAAALRRTVEALAPGEEAGWPLRRLLEGLAVDRPRLPAGLGRDVDTPADAAALGVEIPDAERGRPL
ncbi:molybdenum cofactor guanylyltransferase [Nesterenkonia sp. F]|uniref:molybdenum cofactor guanylyltransferase n=1 Tax=Nesterenkonia sp. F TaxID=795955 RepID=UPI000255D0CC|nr:NTP transferase domain-containing protein [Nesterenkonia sp. F]